MAAKEQGFYVTIHPDHPAVLEILADQEYLRMKEVDPDLIYVAHVETKTAAMEIIMDKLRLAYSKDPSMQHAKEIILSSL